MPSPTKAERLRVKLGPASRSAMRVSKPVPIVMTAWALTALVGLVWSVANYRVTLAGLGLLLVWLTATFVAARFVTRAWVILVCALFLRAGLMMFTGGANIEPANPIEYGPLAVNIINGNGLLADVAGMYSMRAAYPPLYPLLLAGTYAVVGPIAPFVLNTIIDFAAAFAGYLLVKRFTDERLARLAAIALLFWPSAILQSIMPNKEGLYVLLVILFAWAWLEDRPIALGVATGLACLTQPSLAPFFAIAGILWLVRRKWSQSVIAVATASIVMMPWWIRNYIVLGGFVPLTTATGLNLYSQAAGTYAATPQIHSLPEIERSAALTKAGLRIIAADPGAFFIQQARAVIASLGTDAATIPILELVPTIPTNRLYDLRPVLQWPFTAFVVGAAWVSWRARANQFYVLMFCALAQLAIFQIWFQFNPRHRLHLVVLCIFATAVAIKGMAQAGSNAEGPERRKGPERCP